MIKNLSLKSLARLLPVSKVLRHFTSLWRCMVNKFLRVPPPKWMIFSPILVLKSIKILETNHLVSYLALLLAAQIPTDLEITWKLQALEVIKHNTNLPGVESREIDRSQWLTSFQGPSVLLSPVGIFVVKKCQLFWRLDFETKVEWRFNSAEQRTHWNIAILQKPRIFQVKKVSKRKYLEELPASINLLCW